MEVERRTAFQELLNAKTETGERAPNSLQPVVNAVQLQTPAVGLPMLGASKPFTDPTKIFNERHERLRGPVMDDVNKKYSPLPPATSAFDPRFQTPLNRQPAMHDFPKRIQ